MKFIFTGKDKYIEKVNLIHNNLYDYSETEYLGVKFKIKIICYNHGPFYLRADKHLEGRGCPECSRIFKSKSLKDFILEANFIHDNKYNYSKSVYKNNATKLIIECPIHGEFEQVPYSHLSGAGCWKCTNCVSNVENEWLDFANVPQFMRQITIRVDKKWYKVDAYNSQINTVYEFYGDFWHGNPEVYNPDGINFSNKKSFGELYNQTIIRENILKSAGYNLIFIWQNDWLKFKQGNLWK